MSDPAFAIDLVGVTRRFGKARVVDDVTLQVPRGSLCGFVSLNGAGKSTTIRIAVGLLRPTAGTARVAGCGAKNAAADVASASSGRVR